MSVTGVCPVLAVPFDERGELDLVSFRNLVHWVQSLDFNGTQVRSVMLFGVASENHKLRDDEREQLLVTLLQERNAGALTVIASVADQSAELAVARAAHYQELGADAINILPPSFLSPSKEQVLAHIERVLQSVSIPVIIQHLPQAGGLEIVDELLHLHDSFPHFVAIKCEANPPTETVARIAAQSVRQVSTLVGWGGTSWAEGIAAGASGVQPGCSLADLYLWAQAALDESDNAEFVERLSNFIPWVREWIETVETLIAVEKHVLVERGLIASPYCRMPTVTVTTQHKQQVADAISLAKSVAAGSYV